LSERVRLIIKVKIQAGSDGYNQDLSERRADSIKHYLVGKFGIASDDLITVGYGKSKPKDPNALMDLANRRVQVVNMAERPRRDNVQEQF
jgi:outer membrane protein OmpA-like peptidoglycan-associated protein